MQNASADSGPDGIAQLLTAAAQERPFDVVILDMDMPEMDGMTVARKIKSDPAIAGIPLIMLTSTGMRGDASEARQCGISAYLTKPVRQMELHATLEQVLGDYPAGETPQMVTRYTLAEATQQLNLTVLVAEDNPTNQEVAAGMLKALGCRVELADNGHAAVAAVRHQDYDMILMDCQMPVMDGYLATAEIRRAERQKTPHRHTPIIALTANALEGDREKCLVAGMDDYMSKPFRSKDLLEMIQRWKSQRTLKTVQSVELAPTPPSSPSPPIAQDSRDNPVDKGILYALKALQIEGEPDFLQSLVRTYLDGADALVDQLDAADARNDTDQLAFIAHRFKSSSANVGAMGLSEYCRDLEMTCKKHLDGDISAMIAAIATEYTAVRDVLKGELEAV
ncbi:response regulator [Desulfosarcina cetonica]|uniref:response regulator n=1 Tax=Desulfosarcina cetonica TaxID=90730 RepID=UPI0006CF8EE4|nr:response regulator [Desulfosarcina cetonica]